MILEFSLLYIFKCQFNKQKFKKSINQFIYDLGVKTYLLAKLCTCLFIVS